MKLSVTQGQVPGIGRNGSLLIKVFQTYNAVNVEVEVGQYDSVTKTMKLTKHSNRIPLGEENGSEKDQTAQVIASLQVSTLKKDSLGVH